MRVINWTEICDDLNFTVHDGPYLSPCFISVTLDIPSTLILTIFASYYFGLLQRAPLNNVAKLRICFLLSLALSWVVRFVVLMVQNGGTLPYTEYINLALYLLCWTLVSLCIAGTDSPIKQLNSLMFIKLIVCITDLVGVAISNSDELKLGILVCSLGSYLCYFITFIQPHHPGIALIRQPLLINDDLSNYGSFEGLQERIFTGEDKSNCLSRLVFAWVWKLVKLGKNKGISAIDDLFELPDGLKVTKIWSRFSRNLPKPDLPQDENDIYFARPRYGLFRMLNKCFYIEFYSLAIVKIISDALSFSGPILLNYLVTFLESGDEPLRNGYYYSLGLFLSTVLGAFFSTQFSYSIAKVGMKVRCAVVCLVYRKTMTVSLAQLADSFTTGQVLNFASSDADRVVNFCQSFHQFWSLPVQIGIALYLLHQQIGLAFLAGLGYTLLLIPVNRVLAKKIAFLSQERMDRKDKRIKITNEIFSGIRAVKMHSWEGLFLTDIENSRVEELKFLKKRQYLDALCVYFWATTPVMISVITFFTYSLMGYQLTAAKIFTCLALFGMLVTPLNAFPWVFNGLLEAWVSLKRLEQFMDLQDLNHSVYYTTPNDENKIAFSDAVFKWDQSDEMDPSFSLGPLNLAVADRQFVGIVGEVGSGKSSLFSALLSNMYRLRGRVDLGNCYGDYGISVAIQEPWIQNATIKNNILFGLPYNGNRYLNVIEACALRKDLEAMPAGDETEVGERGLSLSGGQKSRLALARAVYQDKDIYLLDDPFSAVDVNVADHLSVHCINGLLKNKTVLLCTHHHRYLEDADVILRLKNGRIIERGKPKDILKQYDQFEITEQSNISEPQITTETNDGQLIEEEEKASGTVKLFVYKAYLKAVGIVVSTLVLSALLLMQCSRVFSDGWLTYWITQNTNVSNSTEPEVLYLSVYGTTALINSLITLIRAFAFAYGGIKAATYIHENLLNVIFKAPIRFFDITPMGRILNRFSSDLNMVDDSLPFILNIFLDQIFRVIAVIGVTCFSLYWMIPVYLLLFVLYYFIQNLYRQTSRDVKRLCSVSLSPVYAHFSETLDGLSTIRAMGASDRFCNLNDQRLEANQRANFAGLAASNWLSFNLQLLGVIVITAVALLAVLEHHLGGNGVSPALVGLAVSYALTITSLLNGVVTSFTEVEKEMVSVERISYYIESVPSERHVGFIEPPFCWPVCGVIYFEGVHLRYQSNYHDALRGVTFETRPGEKIGIVGRTGSGKSSLFQALFRTVELNAGQILIDGVDISHLDLTSLRSRLAIIPQEPFLFSGTLRKNLDPQHNHEDPDLWKALEQCHMAGVVRQIGGLKATVAQGGRNFSLGQRQLICLARALLDRVKVLCLDEATASIDSQTDEAIQKSLKVAFKGATVLTVAHRLETVLNCDRVMVMDCGHMVELGPPKEVFQQKKSHFSNLK